MSLGKLDRVDARIKRQIARGVSPADLRAARKARKAAWKKQLEPMQKETNAYHAAWIAAQIRSPK